MGKFIEQLVVVTLLACMAVGLCASLPGCRSCTQDPEARKKAEEEKKKKEAEAKKKKKPDFEHTKFFVLPGDVSRDRTAAQGPTAMPVKPGHWNVATKFAKANNFDFPAGQLHVAMVNRRGRILELERSPYRVTISRPVSLPKGQTKSLEVPFYVPRTFGAQDEIVQLQGKMTGPHGSREIFARSQPTRLLSAHQYFFVVLARQPEQYGFLGRLDCIKPPRTDMEMDTTDTLYQVVRPVVETQKVPLPTHPLAWTTIAVVLWDDVNPDDLTPAQQGALIDWIHFGGQLVITGADTLDLLQTSFLGPYLPARAGKIVKLDQAAVEPLNDAWAVGSQRNRQPLQLKPDSPIEAVELRKHERAEYVPRTAQLMVERRVGRGRVLATAVSLTDRQLSSWRHFDGLFNACVLRHPGRQFRNQGGMLDTTWRGRHAGRFDPRVVSSLRYFSRDVDSPATTRWLRSRPPVAPEPRSNDPFGAEPEPLATPAASGYVAPPAEQVASRLTDAPLSGGGFTFNSRSGVAGWTDSSPCADAARAALKQAAGVEVPNAGFVLRVLAVYLVVLVPVNWGLFRLIGRVEWAWIAAPLIAILGTVAVVRLAQLDIGFARSRAEVAVLELHGDYDRGHLTRYTGLYSSLATGYRVTMDDDSALVLPFSGLSRNQLQQRSRRTVALHRGRETQLDGFQVLSNSTDYLHSEQMLAVGGTVRLVPQAGQLILENNSQMALNGVGLLRRTIDGDIEVAWVGRSEPGTTAAVRFRAAEDPVTLLPEWNDAPETDAESASGELTLRPMLEVAQEPRQLRTGDVRLIGWTDRPLTGIEIRPRASQTSALTLVVVHLNHGRWTAPEADANHKLDVAL